jgi:hypothetical protein
MRIERDIKEKIIPEFKACKLCGCKPDYTWKDADGGWSNAYGNVRCLNCGISISIMNKRERDSMVNLEHKWNKLMEQ